MAGKLLHFLAIYHPLLMAHGIYLRVQLFVRFSMDLFFSHQKSDQKKRQYVTEMPCLQVTSWPHWPQSDLLERVLSRKQLLRVRLLSALKANVCKNHCQPSRLIPVASTPAGLPICVNLMSYCEGKMSFLFFPHNHCLSSSLSKSNMFFSLGIIMTMVIASVLMPLSYIIQDSID